jgi:hypothetical protein
MGTGGGGLKRSECEAEHSFLSNTEVIHGNRDKIVDIATGYWLDDRGVGIRVPVGSRIFSSPRRPNRLWGPGGKTAGM